MLEPIPGERIPSILDDEYLTGLRRHLGTIHACELLADGVLALVGRLDRLAEAGLEGDTGEIAALSHEVAGAAGHLGLALVSYYAALASRAARTRGGDPARWIEALVAVRSESVGALRDYCASCRQQVGT